MSAVTAVVVGLGYIGLPLAVSLALADVQVRGVDIDQLRLNEIARGRAPIHEPELADALTRAIASGRLISSNDAAPADAFLVTVPTPLDIDRTPDLSHVRDAVTLIAPHLRPGNVVILESTSPPGTTELVSRWLREARPDLRLPPLCTEPDIHIAYCPERVLPGRIMAEITSADRIIGGLTNECAQSAAEFYRRFCTGRIALTTARTAEMTKLAENAFRDVNIAFANELASLCDPIGVDVREVIELANRHPRVQVLSPGPGVGGHCVAVDPWFLVAAAPDHAPLIRQARLVNDARPNQIVAKVNQLLEGATEPTVACLGLSFKANVDDLRSSPAVEILDLLASGHPVAKIYAVEPHIDALPAVLVKHANVHLTDLEHALDTADAVILLVDHDVFRAINPAVLPAIVLDTRGIWAER